MIEFHQQDVNCDILDKSKLVELLESILRDHGYTSDVVNIIITSDESILSLNKKFLNHDEYTDILTFDYTETGTEKISDIYISYDRVNENATEFNQSTNRELVRVMIHGMLHLAGYKDQKTEEKSVMRQKEDEYLALFGL
jgi:probable rRNA maturation factor